jgi:HSP20 family protein
VTTPWDPFAEIAWCTSPDAASFAPAVDILEEAHAILVTMELPGVRPEDVTVEADPHVLTVRGERRRSRLDAEEIYHRRERAYGAFSRTFALPDRVDGRSAVSVMAEGVLTVRLPKIAAEDSLLAVLPVRRAS